MRIRNVSIHIIFYENQFNVLGRIFLNSRKKRVFLWDLEELTFLISKILCYHKELWQWIYVQVHKILPFYSRPKNKN